MKLPFFIFVLGLGTKVTANGDRGAAERALIWGAYLMEEVFTDSSQWSIAPDCVPAAGTSGRTGFRGQAKRCTYLDLIEHIWTPTPKKFSDPSKGYLDPSLPDRSKTAWTIDLNDAEHLTPKQIADATFTVSGRGAPLTELVKDASGVPVKDANGKPVYQPKLDANGQPMFKKGKALTPGYAGAFLIEKVIKGVSANEHFKGMGMIGEKIAKAKAEVDKLSNSDTAKLKLNNWHTNTINAADYIVDLREMDGHKVIAGSDGLKQVAGLKVITKNVDAETKSLGWLSTYKAYDDNAMSEDKDNQAKFGGKAGVLKAINDRLTAMTVADGGNHETMVKEIKKTRTAITAGPPSC